MADQDPSLILEVFNERAGILTFFGMLGGSVRAAVLKTTWREGLRVIFVGGAVSFGVGVLAPVVLKPWIGDIPDDISGALGTLTSASFLTGLIAVTLVERFIAGPPDDMKRKGGSNRSKGGRHSNDTYYEEPPYQEDFD